MSFLNKIIDPLSRFSLFLIYFWFGALKVIGESPASELVQQLFEATIPMMSFGAFLIAFGLFECLVGIVFLVKGAERIAMVLFGLHMITTVGPLLLVPQSAWSGFLIPTLEGQYIIKNLVLITTAIGVFLRADTTKRIS